MKRKIIHIGIIIIFFIIPFMGCMDPSSEPELSVDLSLASLTLEDFNQQFTILNQEHVTEPYIVTEDKLFKGLKVFEKYEIYFIINDTTFVIQQSAILESEEKSNEFIDTLKNKPSFPGIESDWMFYNETVDIIGDEAILKKNITIELNTTIFMLVFRMDNIVSILVTNGISKEDISSYAAIIENRIENQL